MKVFGCGGTGVNIVKKLMSSKQEDLLSQQNYYCIDTSKANLRDTDIDENSIFILDDKDGSGGLRSENHESVSKVIPSVLERFEPGQFNIVIFSLSGGSGSVIGPLLISELLNQDKAVVAITIGNETSKLSCNNNFKTLQSLESISSNRKKPVPIMFFSQNENVKRTEVDKMVILNIAYLSILNSGRNLELDSQDIYNWLNYHRVTTYKPKLTLLEIYPSNDALNQCEAPISLISIFTEHDNELPSIIPEYSKSGYFSNEFKRKLNNLFGEKTSEGFYGIHYLIQSNGIKKIFDHYKKIDNELISEHKKIITDDSILGSTETITSTGLVL